MKQVNTLSTPDNFAAFINPADYVNNYVLAAGVAETVTVPSGARLASFSPAVPFYANFNGAVATVPGADITDGTGHSYNPTTRRVDGIATFSIISASAGVVTVEFYTA